MAKLRVFISSTCYDLKVLRSQLKTFVTKLGHEPLLSDNSDVLFDPRHHTHESCIHEIVNCDVLVLIIGSRFGGSAIPSAIKMVDLEKMKFEPVQVQAELSATTSKTTVSITQLEVLRAIEMGIPIYAFIDQGVFADHFSYEKNKERIVAGTDKPVSDFMIYPNIDNQGTAKFIFEFINYIRHRTSNNNVLQFSRLEEIEDYLRSQWSALLQRLLHEQRSQLSEALKIDAFANQLADLKAVVLTAITPGDLKETAKGTLEYRSMIQFLYSLTGATNSPTKSNYDIRQIATCDINWEAVLQMLGVVDIKPRGQGSAGVRTIALIRNDGTYFAVMYSIRAIQRTEAQWEEFRSLMQTRKLTIIEAVLEASGSIGKTSLRYIPRKFQETIAHRKETAHGASNTLSGLFLSPTEDHEDGDDEIEID